MGIKGREAQILPRPTHPQPGTRQAVSVAAAGRGQRHAVRILVGPHPTAIEEGRQLYPPPRRRDRRVVAKLDRAQEPHVAAPFAHRPAAHAIRPAQGEIFRRVEILACPLAIDVCEEGKISRQGLKSGQARAHALIAALRLQSRRIRCQCRRHARQVEIAPGPIQGPARQPASPKLIPQFAGKNNIAGPDPLVLKPPDSRVIGERLLVEFGGKPQVQPARADQAIVQARPDLMGGAFKAGQAAEPVDVAVGQMAVACMGGDAARAPRDAHLGLTEFLAFRKNPCKTGLVAQAGEVGECDERIALGAAGVGTAVIVAPERSGQDQRLLDAHDKPAGIGCRPRHEPGARRHAGKIIHAQKRFFERLLVDAVRLHLALANRTQQLFPNPCALAALDVDPLQRAFDDVEGDDACGNVLRRKNGAGKQTALFLKRTRHVVGKRLQAGNAGALVLDRGSKSLPLGGRQQIGLAGETQFLDKEGFACLVRCRRRLFAAGFLRRGQLFGLLQFLLALLFAQQRPGILCQGCAGDTDQQCGSRDVPHQKTRHAPGRFHLFDSD